MDSTHFKADFIKLLDALHLFPLDITKLLTEYWNPSQLEGIFLNQWMLYGADDESHPYGVTSDNQEFIYVTDWYGHSLCVYTLDGRYLGRKVPSNTTTPLLDFLYPRGITFYGNQIYTVDQKYLRVIDKNKFTTTYKWNLPPDDFKDGTIGGGTCICIDSVTPYIFLTMQNSHRIFVYTLTGKSLKQYGRIGMGKNGNSTVGSFNRPKGIACDSSYLYICDSGNHRIQLVETRNGDFIKAWGQQGRKNGNLHSPESIWIYDEYLYIGDSYRVQVFNKHGEFVQRVGAGLDPGTQKGEFNDAAGLCILKGRLFVADFWNSRIQIFK